MKVGADSPIKVKVTVKNSLGDIAYDFYEFYINDPPNVGTTTYKILNEPDNSKGTAMESLWRISLSGWYDKADDPTQRLKLKIYMILKQAIGVT